MLAKIEWIIATPFDFSLTIKCLYQSKSDTKVLHIKAPLTKLDLKNGCKATSPYFTILPTYHFASNDLFQTLKGKQFHKISRTSLDIWNFSLSNLDMTQLDLRYVW